MTRTYLRPILIAILAVHTLVTAWSLRDAGFMGPFPPFSERHVYQIFSDLIVSLLILVLFIYKNIRRQGRALAGFYFMALMIPLVGSFSPLVYLLINPELLTDS